RDPTPPELPEPSELPEPEEGSKERKSDYKTALDYQNTDTRCSMMGLHNELVPKMTSVIYHEIANAIFWRSDGQIDLRKTGTYAMASLRFFQDVARCPRKAENLSPEEDQWIRSAYIGGLTWAEPYEGIATELDFNEYYPHILACGSTCWPIGPEEFKTFTHISVNPINFNLKYGIYHVFIEGQPAGQKCTRTFRYNPAGYYTHHDIQMAIDLGLHIELSSESPNALIFGPNQLMRGDEIFYQWASYLTEIKHEGGQAGTVAKHMLVSLWERLYSDRRRPGPHRRMAPFISARGCKTVSEKIRSLGDRIKRVHTDGFILSGKISDQVIGKQAGELKIVNA
ncbi:30817_t:CDS:2, partial [Racocetra persica]